LFVRDVKFERSQTLAVARLQIGESRYVARAREYLTAGLQRCFENGVAQTSGRTCNQPDFGHDSYLLRCTDIGAFLTEARATFKPFGIARERKSL
jgi:hypothetical protein